MRRNPRHRRGREGLDWRTHTHLWHNDYHCGDHGHGYAIHRDMIKRIGLEPPEFSPVVFFEKKKM